MKKFFVPKTGRVLKPASLAVLFVLAACKTDGYSPFVYTNTSAYDISFRTGEKDSPEYRLKKSGTMTLDSDVRGRAEIDGASLKPVYTDWRRAEDDIYSIEFFTRPAIPVIISNTTGDKITLRETGGYLVPNNVIVEGPQEISFAFTIYTRTPSFEISGNTYPAKVSFNIVNKDQSDTMYVLISSP